MDEINIVYRNWEFHLSNDEVEFEVWEFFRFGTMISDACAQTIASWFHSPGSPLSTVLSTMGAVTDDMSISDFVSQKEYDSQNRTGQQELDALKAYIANRQKVKN